MEHKCSSVWYDSVHFCFNFQYHEEELERLVTARPMTAVRGAGYTSSAGQRQFDPLNQATKVPAASQLEAKREDS
jgi:hypothetical protein